MKSALVEWMEFTFQKKENSEMSVRHERLTT